MRRVLGLAAGLAMLACGSSTRAVGQAAQAGSGGAAAAAADAGTAGTAGAGPSNGALGGGGMTNAFGGSFGISGAPTGEVADVHCETSTLGGCSCVGDPGHAIPDDAVSCTSSETSFCCADGASYPASGTCECDSWTCQSSSTACTCGVAAGGTASSCLASAYTHCCKSVLGKTCSCSNGPSVCDADQALVSNCVLGDVACLSTEARVSSCKGADAGTGGAGAAGGAGASGGSAGTAGAAGAGGASGAAGAGGSAGATAVECPAVTVKGSASALLLDDFQDHDDMIAEVGGRCGHWFAYNDGTCGDVFPAPPPSPFPVQEAGRSTLTDGSINAHGASCALFGVGMGFPFNERGTSECPYDASAYKGITFWAKGTGIPYLQLKSASNVNQTFEAVVTLTNTWTQFSLPFLKFQDGQGSPQPLDVTSLLDVIIFGWAQGGATDVTLDDISFYVE